MHERQWLYRAIVFQVRKFISFNQLIVWLQVDLLRSYGSFYSGFCRKILSHTHDEEELPLLGAQY